MEDLEIAKKILKAGGIIIFPTETAFGVGCRLDNEQSVARLFKIRQRPENQAVPVLVNSIKMAQDYLLPVPEAVEDLMKRYWPGALTIVYPCQKQKVISLVRGQGKTLGVRMPNHKVPLDLIEELGVPILAPSANFHGKPTPYKYEELDPDFVKRVDFVVKGQCLVRLVSTVIDCTFKPWKIIRQGAVKIDFNTLKEYRRLVEKILIIDTSDRCQTIVGLAVGGKRTFLKGRTGDLKSQNLLPLIDKILKKHKVKLQGLTAIKVSTGPGSFTGLRVGLAVANTLGWVLKIPVNGKRSIVLPKYSC